jgi:hypothetical protein
MNNHMMPSGSKRPSLAKAAVALTGLALLGAVLASSTPTLAAWSDQTHHEGTMATKTLPVPTGTCSYTGTGNSRHFVFTWKFPAGSGHDLTNVQFLRSTTLTNPTLIGLLPAAYSSTGPNASGEYTTTIDASLSGGYFTDLYSDTAPFLLGLRSTENGWTSAPLTVNASLRHNNTGSCTG